MTAQSLGVRDRIECLIQSDMPKILMLSHSMGGGVARHLLELSEALAGRAHVFLLRVQLGAGGKLVLVLPSVKSNEPVHLAFSWPKQQGLLWRFLAQLGLTRAHVHHIMNWPHGFWQAFLAQHIPFDLTLHDHCIFSSVSADKSDIARAHWLGMVQRCFSADTRVEAEVLHTLALSAERLFSPSQALLEQLKFFFPAIDEKKIAFRPHPEAEHASPYPLPFMRPLAKSEPLRVLCLGMLSAEKGAQVLARVAREADRQSLPFEFHLLGSCHVHLPATIQRHGSYLDQQVMSLMERIGPHMLWLPARCPETWSYTLSAGLSAGLPVVATDIGVFPERLRQRPLTWLCDVDYSADQWLSVFSALRNQHLQPAVAPSVWRYKRAEPFYTVEPGYLAGSEVLAWEARLKPLEEWQINQALVEGLPATSLWRDRVLRYLVRLKYSTTLAPLVRMIPYTWQRKLKRLISRAPLYEPSAADEGREI